MNMLHIADPQKFQEWLNSVGRVFSRLILRVFHPGVMAIAKQLQQDYDFNDIKRCCQQPCQTSDTC
jgi:cyclase